MNRPPLRVVLAVVLLFSAACATVKKVFTPAFARLESAVVGDRYARSPSREDVRVVRAGAIVQPSVGMRVSKGDSITTSRTTRLVLVFGAGYEVTLDTGTAIFIENPSIFMRVGQAFIRTLVGRRGGQSEPFKTNTDQVTLHGRGTEYLVTVADQRTDVSVADGVVDATSRDGRWPGVTYTRGQQGRIEAQRAPVRMQPLTEAQLQARLGWVRRVEAITKVQVPRVEAMTRSDARATLQRAGFRVTVTDLETDAAAPGQVVEQSPRAGQIAAPGSEVALTVAKAPRLVLCTVPKILGQTEAIANRTLAEARLKGERAFLGRGAETVTSQDPKEGSRVACNSTVTYRIEINVQ